mmetsp:Transcript_57444/g.65878  ORF Transcript_57444/g.65878 Transcript_57444/m.65878 type:complete len:308 (-) Transcript_57444:736-1659(-)
MDTLKGGGTERQRLGKAPLHTLASADGLGTRFNGAIDDGMGLKVSWDGGELLADLLQGRKRKASFPQRAQLHCVRVTGGVGFFVGGADLHEVSGVLGIFELLAQQAVVLLLFQRRLFFAHDAIRDKLSRNLVNDNGLLGDRLVHDRLRELWHIRFIVTIPAVAHEINDDVALVLLAEAGSNAGALDNGIDIVTVNVEDRGVANARQISAIWRRSTLLRISGETDLVVDDNVNGSADVEVLQVTESHNFVADALPSKGSITVENNGQILVHGRVLRVELTGTGLANNKWVHSLQVGGVRQKVDEDLLS